MRITIVGTGYVGLVTGTCFAEIGHTVEFVDKDGHKIALLRDQTPPIFEPGLAELIKSNYDRMSFHTELKDAADTDGIFVCVGTPSMADGSADLTAIIDVAEDLAKICQSQSSEERYELEPVVIIKSTVPPGTCGQFLESYQNSMVAALGHSPNFLPPIHLGFNPEFLKEGHAIEDFMRPDRIVVGASSSRAIDFLDEVYQHFIRNGHQYLTMDIRSAEMSKYASNAMLAARISSMNEIAEICEKVGADVMRVKEVVGSDTRIGSKFLYPGLGFGGSCFPKDVSALFKVATDYDIPAHMLIGTMEVNKRQRHRMCCKIYERFMGSLDNLGDEADQLKGLKLGIWGLSFKPKTDDVREAPAEEIIKFLLARGAEVACYDPAVKHITLEGPITMATDMYSVVEGADALILCTEWPEFRTPDWELLASNMCRPIIFDGRNQYNLNQLGGKFEYHCFGRTS